MSGDVVPLARGGLEEDTALLWRALCEFYVAIFRISDDLRALRESGQLGPR